MAKSNNSAKKHDNKPRLPIPVVVAIIGAIATISGTIATIWIAYINRPNPPSSVPVITPTQQQVVLVNTPITTLVPTSTAALIPQPSLAATLPSIPTIWNDNFNDNQIDTSKWQNPTKSKLIYEMDDVLHLRLRPEDAAQRMYAELHAIPSSHSIKELSFTMMSHSNNGLSGSGAGLVVFLDHDPDLQVMVGPTEMNLSWCEQGHVCDPNKYETYTHPPGPRVGLNVPINVHVEKIGPNIKLEVNGKEWNEPTDKVITNFGFSLSSPANGLIDVTIDDVQVVYNK